jgi:putative ABC transport system permease protein
MEFRPILSAMLRNKTGVFLVGLQIALTLAVVANAVFIIMQRLDKINTPHGIDTPNLIFVQSYGFGPNYDHRDTVRRDLEQRHSHVGRRQLLQLLCVDGSQAAAYERQLL